MNGAARAVLTGVCLAAGVAGGMAIGRFLDTRPEAAVSAAPVRPEAPAGLASLQESFRAAARFAMPSVVHITTRTASPDDFWVPQENVGSGVIVSDKGHVLTNNHVAEGARTLRVRFVDGREFAAGVVGTDAETDLALLKIEVPRDMALVPASFTNSDEVQVGDWCLAIGSPFGYNHTVTAGIVSAKHRRAMLSMPYQDFIQTDAAINPGNSGGALVNVRGELVGVNTAIVSGTRTSEGVGLAISANLVRWVVDRLLKDGRVRRGFLGIVPSDFNDALVAELKNDGIRSVKDLLDDVGLKEPKGVFIVDVSAKSPAEKGGVRKGDVIVEFNGKPVKNQGDMFFRVAEVTPGTTVEVKVLRDRQEKVLKVELAERPPQDLRRRR
jgi:serine protease Do